MSKEAQDFERWIREKLHGFILGEKLDESKIVDADPPGDHSVKMLTDHVTDVGNMIKEANTEDR